MANEELKELELDELKAVSGGVNVDTLDMDYCYMTASNYAKRNPGSYHDEMDKYYIAENQYLSYVNTLGEGVPVPKFSSYLKSNGYGYWFA